MDSRRPWLLVVPCLLAWLAGCDAPPPRSVVLITIDTLRADHLSTYGYQAPTSPAMTRLARNGRRFTHAFSASSCTAPSHTSLLTGRYPSWHTVGTLNGQVKLDPSIPTVAGLLHAAGWRTGAVVSNPVLARSLGLDQGFEVYDDHLEDQELNRPAVGERHAPRAVDGALAWLDDVAGEPFFLWLHIQDAHGPYVPHPDMVCDVPPASSEGPLLPAGEDHSGYEAIPLYQVFGEERAASDYRRRYDCEIAYLDGQLGRLFDRLATDPALGNTLCILTADHGEAFGEDGFYFAHSHSVGLDQVHVPLILAGPGVEPGTVSERPVSNVAVFATILDFLGVRPGQEPAAASLLGRGEAAPVFVESAGQVGVVTDNCFVRIDRRPPGDQAFWQRGNPNTGGFWKPLGRQVVRPLDSGRPSPAEAPDRADELLAAYERRAGQARDALAGLRQGVELSPEQEQALRGLGYVR